MDRDSKGYLTQNDINNFFLSNEISLTYTDLRNIFLTLDENRDGRITYDEFADYILPHLNSTLRNIT